MYQKFADWRVTMYTVIVGLFFGLGALRLLVLFYELSRQEDKADMVFSLFMVPFSAVLLTGTVFLIFEFNYSEISENVNKLKMMTAVVITMLVLATISSLILSSASPLIALGVPLSFIVFLIGFGATIFGTWVLIYGLLDKIKWAQDLSKKVRTGVIFVASTLIMTLYFIIHGVVIILEAIMWGLNALFVFINKDNPNWKGEFKEWWTDFLDLW